MQAALPVMMQAAAQPTINTPHAILSPRPQSCGNTAPWLGRNAEAFTRMTGAA